ncbi:unnamed protein product [Effrenium voratum]|uniref:Uncharacterized protein n=1 Tax=Effrenium voratum TaxID=2562239 RepID=A0AA36MNH3_9DINO|nr:unnamed protein product [Effrenium voratum]
MRVAFKERIALMLGLDHKQIFNCKARDCMSCFTANRFKAIELLIWKVEDLPSADLFAANNVFVEVYLGYNETTRTRVHNNAGSDCIFKESVQLNFDELAEMPEGFGVSVSELAGSALKLQSPKARDRWTACGALAKLGRGALESDGDGAVASALRAAARDADATVRCEAARALGQVGVLASTPELIALLSDEDDGVRWGACEGLGNLAPASAAPALTQALEDEYEDVRGAAAAGLGKLARAGHAAAGADGDPALGGALGPALVPLLTDEAWTVRRSAAEALGRCRWPEAAPELRRAREDRDPRVKQAVEAALQALQAVAGPDAA